MHSVVIQYFIYYNTMQIKSKTEYLIKLLVYNNLFNVLVIQFPYFITYCYTCNTKFETPQRAILTRFYLLYNIFVLL